MNGASISAAALYQARRKAFYALFAPSCSCARFELREENAALRCALCDRPLVARRCA